MESEAVEVGRATRIKHREVEFFNDLLGSATSLKLSLWQAPGTSQEKVG